MGIIIYIYIYGVNSISELYMCTRSLVLMHGSLIPQMLIVRCGKETLVHTVFICFLF